MTFLTLFAADMQKTARVYECLGLSFIEEKHGAGPVHLASEKNGQVLEIYPGLDAASRSVLIGFEVKSLEACRASLKATEAVIVKDIELLGGQKRMIARDPDGRELFVQEAQAPV